MAPRPPTLGHAPAQPWRASTSAQLLSSSGLARGRIDVANLHVGPDRAGAAVLVGDLRLDFDMVASVVERVDQASVFLRDVAPANLPRARDLLVVRVELLVQDE